MPDDINLMHNAFNSQQVPYTACKMLNCDAKENCLKQKYTKIRIMAKVLSKIKMHTYNAFYIVNKFSSSTKATIFLVLKSFNMMRIQLTENNILETLT